MQSLATSPSETARAVPGTVRYACERCKTDKVLAPAPRTLGPAGWLHARILSAGTSLSSHKGARRSFRDIRAEMLARAADDAARSFSDSFRFCHECRRFVCPGCWSPARQICKTCLARAKKRLSPRRMRLRFGLSVAVIAASLLLLAVGVGAALAAVAI